jgi:hypothetical protein
LTAKQGYHGFSKWSNVRCQLCQLFDHSAFQYVQLQSHRQQSSANLALRNISSIGYVDWFPDIGVNQHGTPDVANLTGSESYLSNDHLHIGDGKGFFISNIGHTKLYTPHRTFTLSNVLHVPHIQKPLLFVQKFCLDNNIYFEFHPFLFYIKDLNSKALLFSSQSKNGLYVLSESSSMSIPQAYWFPCVSAFVDLWHRQLGHPTSCIFNFLF